MEDFRKVNLKLAEKNRKLEVRPVSNQTPDIGHFPDPYP